jgi:hypothetical protein
MSDWWKVRRHFMSVPLICGHALCSFEKWISAGSIVQIMCSERVIAL